jgi:uncharacterized oligopeptide transporter (OPT) family protein
VEVRRELTVRAVLTGVLIGAVLTPCNVYSGLKIGWSFNMSITALLLAYAFWQPLGRFSSIPRWTLHESNINQTAASSAASIISGGLVAPIPAYLILTGETLAWMPMSAWVFSVSFLGIWVAWYQRPSLIESGRFAFPVGLATAETLEDIFREGREAAQRLVALLGSLVASAAFKLVDVFWLAVPRWAPTPALKQLGFALDPSLLMLGFGAIIGLRAGVSLLLGAVVAWGALSPWLVATQTIPASALQGESWFQPLVEWLIWPGVTLMVTASLSSMLVRLRWRWPARGDVRLPGGWPVLGLALGAALAVALQVSLFDIHWTMALLSIPVAFVLASVAARVVGETGIAPIGAIGKVSQLAFGIAAPGQAVTNLMTANVAGGAAGQCADLLNDFKTGHQVGASPGRQAVAQCFGILCGSLVGSAVFAAMIPDPAGQLLSLEWPAPAVAVWKSVAETLSEGLGSVPTSARIAMAIAACVGVTLGAAERFAGGAARWLPSGATVGLAFVIPASTSLTIFFGALIAALLGRLAPTWEKRFLIAAAAGLIAGESLFGVFLAIVRVSGVG